jgi:hypothetical protein
MDFVSETSKTLISLVSALIAVLGAVAAQRSRVQARKDSFEDRREALLAAMHAADTHAESLELEAGLLLADLKADVATDTMSLTDDVSDVMDGLEGLTAASEPLRGRGYSAASIAALQYDRRNDTKLRAYLVSERNVCTTLTSSGMKAVLERAHSSLRGIRKI